MDFFEVVSSRYSCRNYRQEAVEEEKLIKCVEAARRSPSACNSQPWKFIIVNGEETLIKARPLISGRLNMNKFVYGAPAFIVMVNEGGNLSSKLGDMVTDRDFSSIDAGIAAQSVCLAAAAQGLASCIMGIFDEKGLKNLLGIPSGKRVSLVLSLGYEEEKPARKTRRKDIKDIISFNKY